MSAGIVDRAVDEDAVRTTALALAQPLVGKAGDTLATIRTRMYAPALAALRDTADPWADRTGSAASARGWRPLHRPVGGGDPLGARSTLEAWVLSTRRS
ncbi:hypothetical protein ACFY1U_10405 [Streptomyces sp. NPDC001351]|uniref:hypothetical protein n=1 Tax=Streptomyces sp. NPDC001351 TaxID=3364564 RepID=UPI0036CB711A